jgi:hypothetical protein
MIGLLKQHLPETAIIIISARNAQGGKMVLKFQYLAKGLISILLIVVLLWHTPTIGSANGDLSGNGVIDLADLIIFADYWLDEGCIAPVCEADIDEAGNVTMTDFAQLAAKWGWRVIGRADYADRLRALWLAECIANWTGIQTEGDRTSPPFYTDVDWASFGFVLGQDPWYADDDTDIEYVYCHLMDKHGTYMLGAEQIADGWMEHINSYIWVSDERARWLMNYGYVPPQTSLLALNDLALMIDAQLTTEIFGVFAPSRPDVALEAGLLPVQTTATGYAAHAAQYFSLLYCLASGVDRSLSRKEQVLWLADETRKYIPDSSKSADIYDFVKADYLANPDKDDWESTRDKIYIRYQRDAELYGFRYQSWVESSVNFAAGVMALLYGEGDWRKTVKIGTLAGWDSDNSTATLGGLLGFMYGYDELTAQFPEQSSFSDRYWIERTRDNMPDYLPDDWEAEDTFTMLASRMIDIIDIAVEEAGGVVDLEGDQWLLPPAGDISPSDMNPLTRLTKRSANVQVRQAGGTVTAESSVASGSNVEVMADGFEHDFSGAEWWPSGEDWYYSTRLGSGHSGEVQTLSVTYDREVEVSIIRYIEGAGDSGCGYFTSAAVEVRIDGLWQSPPCDITASEALDANQDYQIIDFMLSEAVEASGIRIAGAVGGSYGYVTALELDALSLPMKASAPFVVITNPSDGDILDEGANVTVEASAVDLDGTVVVVEFFDGESKFAEDATAPYIAELTGLSLGTHTLTAVATDDQGRTAKSAEVNISVRPVAVAGMWRSYDVVMQPTGAQGIVMDGEGMAAELQFYESTNDNGVDKGGLFDAYISGSHPESFNHAEHIWYPSSEEEVYPYAAKSAVGRGLDSGEANAPAPTGSSIMDLQLHPPESEHLTVAAFIVPVTGDYSVYGLAARRVASDGELIGYKVFDSDENLIAHLVASANQDWVTDSAIYSLGTLEAGESIYFAVDREDAHYYWDAAEIVWTIEKTRNNASP